MVRTKFSLQVTQANKQALCCLLYPRTPSAVIQSAHCLFKVFPFYFYFFGHLTNPTTTAALFQSVARGSKRLREKFERNWSSARRVYSKNQRVASLFGHLRNYVKLGYRNEY